jgi:hypothetical protein
MVAITHWRAIVPSHRSCIVVASLHGAVLTTSCCRRVLLSCCPTIVPSHSPLKWQSGMAGLPLPFPDYFRGEGVMWWCLACVAATAAGQLWRFIGSKKRGR